MNIPNLLPTASSSGNTIDTPAGQGGAGEPKFNEVLSALAGVRIPGTAALPAPAGALEGPALDALEVTPGRDGDATLAPLAISAEAQAAAAASLAAWALGPSHSGPRGDGTALATAAQQSPAQRSIPALTAATAKGADAGKGAHAVSQIELLEPTPESRAQATLPGQAHQPITAAGAIGSADDLVPVSRTTSAVAGEAGHPATGPAATGSSAAPAPAAPSVTTQLSLPAALASDAWSDQLGQKLTSIIQRGNQQVELRLNPAAMGPLSVSLQFDDQGASAHFLSAHAAVRTAVEQAIPSLRDALAEQGIALGEATVEDETGDGGDRQANERGRDVVQRDNATGSADEDADIATTTRPGDAGLVDTYV